MGLGKIPLAGPGGRPMAMCAAALALVLYAGSASGPVAHAAGGIAVAPRSAAEANRQAKEQTETIAIAVRTLRRLAGQPMPRDLSGAEAREWSAQTEWLDGIVKRLAAHAARLAPVARGASPAMIQEMTRLNLEFLSLQSALKREARRIRTLSHAARTRYNAAMRAIGHLE